MKKLNLNKIKISNFLNKEIGKIKGGNNKQIETINNPPCGQTETFSGQQCQ